MEGGRCCKAGWLLLIFSLSEAKVRKMTEGPHLFSSLGGEGEGVSLWPLPVRSFNLLFIFFFLIFYLSVFCLFFHHLISVAYVFSSILPSFLPLSLFPLRSSHSCSLSCVPPSPCLCYLFISLFVLFCASPLLPPTPATTTFIIWRTNLSLSLYLPIYLSIYLSLSLSLSLSFCHTHTHTHTHSLSLSLTGLL